MRARDGYRTLTRSDATPEFERAMSALTGSQLVDVRDQLRVWYHERYLDGVRDGKLEALSGVWGLDPDAAAVAQEVSDLLPPLPAVKRHRLDRAPSEQLRPKERAA